MQMAYMTIMLADQFEGLKEIPKPQKKRQIWVFL